MSAKSIEDLLCDLCVLSTSVSKTFSHSFLLILVTHPRIKQNKRCDVATNPIVLGRRVCEPFLFVQYLWW